MKNSNRRISLNRETIRHLSREDLIRVEGGNGSDPGARTQPNCVRPASLPNCTTTTL